MNISLIAKIIYFNPKNNEILIKYPFINSKDMNEIEEIIKEDNKIRIDIKKTKFRRSKTYNQLKRYFAMLKMIIINADSAPTSENIKILDEYIKEKIFPKKEINNELIEKLEGYKNIEKYKIIPKKELTIEQLNDIMQKIEELYPEINFLNN